MIGMVTTMTWLTMFQGQPLELEEDQPDEERVNEQQDEFHYDCPPLLLACSSSSATRARSCSDLAFLLFRLAVMADGFVHVGAISELVQHWLRVSPKPRQGPEQSAKAKREQT